MNLKHQTQAIQKQAAAIRALREGWVREITTKESTAFMKNWRKAPRVLSDDEYSALHTADKVDYLAWGFRKRGV